MQKKSTNCVVSLSMPAAVTSQAGDKLWQEFVTTAITNPDEDKLYIAIAVLTGSDSGYAIITYPPRNTYGRWISSGNRIRFTGISFKAAITDWGDKLWQP